MQSTQFATVPLEMAASTMHQSLPATTQKQLCDRLMSISSCSNTTVTLEPGTTEQYVSAQDPLYLKIAFNRYEEKVAAENLIRSLKIWLQEEIRKLQNTQLGAGPMSILPVAAMNPSLNWYANQGIPAPPFPVQPLMPMPSVMRAQFTTVSYQQWTQMYEAPPVAGGFYPVQSPVVRPAAVPQAPSIHDGQQTQESHGWYQGGNSWENSSAQAMAAPTQPPPRPPLVPEREHLKTAPTTQGDYYPPGKRSRTSADDVDDYQDQDSRPTSRGWCQGGNTWENSSAQAMAAPTQPPLRPPLVPEREHLKTAPTTQGDYYPSGKRSRTSADDGDDYQDQDSRPTDPSFRKRGTRGGKNKKKPKLNENGEEVAEKKGIMSSQKERETTLGDNSHGWYQGGNSWENSSAQAMAAPSQPPLRPPLVPEREHLKTAPTTQGDYYAPGKRSRTSADDGDVYKDQDSRPTDPNFRKRGTRGGKNKKKPKLNENGEEVAEKKGIISSQKERETILGDNIQNSETTSHFSSEPSSQPKPPIDSFEDVQKEILDQVKSKQEVLNSINSKWKTVSRYQYPFFDDCPPAPNQIVFETHVEGPLPNSRITPEPTTSHQLSHGEEELFSRRPQRQDPKDLEFYNYPQSQAQRQVIHHKPRVQEDLPYRRSVPFQPPFRERSLLPTVGDEYSQSPPHENRCDPMDMDDYNDWEEPYADYDEKEDLDHITIATWNVVDASRVEARRTIDFDLCGNVDKKVDIIGLQSTNISAKEVRDTRHYKWYCSRDEYQGTGREGVAILVRKAVNINVPSFQPVSENLCKADIEWKDKRFSIVCTYLPTFDDPSRDSTVEMLISVLEEIKNPVILLGDFNAHINKTEGSKQILSKFGEKMLGERTNENGKLLLSLAEAYDLYCHSTLGDAVDETSAIATWTNGQRMLQLSYIFGPKSDSFAFEWTNPVWKRRHDPPHKLVCVKVTALEEKSVEQPQTLSKLMSKLHSVTKVLQMQKLKLTTNDKNQNAPSKQNNPKLALLSVAHTLQEVSVDTISSGQRTVVLMPRNKESLYAAIALQLLGSFKTHQELSLAATRLHRRAVVYVRQNREEFSTPVCENYSKVHLNHQLAVGELFDNGCVYLSQPGHLGEEITMRAIAAIFNAAITVHKEVAVDGGKTVLSPETTTIVGPGARNSSRVSVLKRLSTENHFDALYPEESWELPVLPPERLQRPVRKRPEVEPPFAPPTHVEQSMQLVPTKKHPARPPPPTAMALLQVPLKVKDPVRPFIAPLKIPRQCLNIAPKEEKVSQQKNWHREEKYVHEANNSAKICKKKFARSFKPVSELSVATWNIGTHPNDLVLQVVDRCVVTNQIDLLCVQGNILSQINDNFFTPATDWWVEQHDMSFMAFVIRKKSNIQLTKFTSHSPLRIISAEITPKKFRTKRPKVFPIIGFVVEDENDCGPLHLKLSLDKLKEILNSSPPKANTILFTFVVHQKGWGDLHRKNPHIMGPVCLPGEVTPHGQRLFNLVLKYLLRVISTVNNNGSSTPATFKYVKKKVETKEQCSHIWFKDRPPYKLIKNLRVWHDISRHAIVLCRIFWLR